MKLLIKRLFCKHHYEIAKFPMRFPGETDITQCDCTDLTGWSLLECNKCGKSVVKKLYRINKE